MEFKHKPVMLDECIEGLNIKPDGVYFDGTLGGAGHSSAILKKLSEKGLLVATDKDDDAIAVSTDRLSKIASNFKLVKSDFKKFKDVIASLGINEVNGVLLDLGVSSYQLDNLDRGFSYKSDAPLDMRMDKSNPLTAEVVVNEYSKEQLIKILFEYGEEPFTKKIVDNIISARENARITTTGELVEIIRKSVPIKVQKEKGHPAKRVFQAIRIEVNQELTGLAETIENMVKSLKRGGRIVIITFHSLEDRIVKSTFKNLSQGCVCPPSFPICVCNHKPEIKIITKKPIEAGQEERENNSRCLCAKLRIAEKL